MTRAADPRVYTNELLERTIMPEAGQRVLALGVGTPVLVAWARAVGSTGLVVAIEHWLPDWRALQLAAQRERLASLQTFFTATLDVLPVQPFAIVAIDCSSYPSNRALYRLAYQAAQRLAPNGTLYAAGPKESGIQPLAKRMGMMLGNVAPLAYRKGQRIEMALRTGEIAPLAEESDEGPFLIEIGDVEWELEYEPAAFAKGAVDEATAMLIGAMEIEADDRVLDLGCGAGVMGMAAAILTPEHEVVMVDADAYALALASRNCRRNGVTNVRIEAADVIDTIAAERFSVVLCNPPFHQRHEHTSGLAERFMRGAHDVLTPKGRLYFVANRFLPYETRLAALFTEVSEVAGDERYKVLLAQGPK